MNCTVMQLCDECAVKMIRAGRATPHYSDPNVSRGEFGIIYDVRLCEGCSTRQPCTPTTVKYVSRISATREDLMRVVGEECAPFLQEINDEVNRSRLSHGISAAVRRLLPEGFARDLSVTMFSRDAGTALMPVFSTQDPDVAAWLRECGAVVA